MIEDILRRQSGGKIGYYAPGETMTAEKPPFFVSFFFVQNAFIHYTAMSEETFVVIFYDRIGSLGELIKPISLMGIQTNGSV